MSRVINLPSGETATLRDAKTLKQKDRTKVLLSSNADNAVAGGLSMTDTLIAALIEEWSFDLILPSVKIEMLGELAIADYDVLQTEAEAAMQVLFPKLGQTLEAEADPKAPTAK